MVIKTMRDNPGTTQEDLVIDLKVGGTTFKKTKGGTLHRYVLKSCRTAKQDLWEYHAVGWDQIELFGTKNGDYEPVKNICAIKSGGRGIML